MTIYRDVPLTILPQNHYKTILADPPWRFLARSNKGYKKAAPYKTMTLDEIKALPVKSICAKHAVVIMWVIDSHTELAHDVLKAWGFKFKTIGLYWAKTNADGTKFPMGTGFWTRANPEHAYLGYLEDEEQEMERCFLATTGQPKRDSKSVHRLMVSPRREHSRKPDETHERVERLVPGPYLEMFSRTDRPGWDVWGEEAGHFAQLEARKKILHEDLEAMALI